MRVTTSVVPFLVACLAGLSGACGSPLVVSDRDDVGRDDENVHVYATGATVAFQIRGARPFLDATTLTATSSDETVFVVEDGEGDLITILTVGAGVAELVFREDGTVVDSRRLEVRDAAGLRLQLETFAEADDDLMPAPITVVDPIHVLRGRETRLVAHAFDADDAELFGHAITTFEISDRNWSVELGINGPFAAVTLAPNADAEDALLVLHVGGGLRLEVPVHARNVGGIERIVLDEGGVDGDRGQGRRSVVVAVAEDAAGTLLLGNPAWQLEGENAGIGFALEYEVGGFGDPEQELVARLGDTEVRRRIRAKPGSANAIDGSCAGAPGGLPIMLLALLRRRRRSP